jgi:hypothetical protein
MRCFSAAGIKESDTGLAPPSQWDLVSDKQMMGVRCLHCFFSSPLAEAHLARRYRTPQEEHPLQVARCTKIINAGADDAKYVINLRQYAKFVVALGEKVRGMPPARIACADHERFTYVLASRPLFGCACRLRRPTSKKICALVSIAISTPSRCGRHLSLLTGVA